MDLVSDWWVEREQAIFLNVLRGLFTNGGALVAGHLNGISFVAISAGAYAANTELATAANWQVVKDLKNIPIVCLLHKVA